MSSAPIAKMIESKCSQGEEMYLKENKKYVSSVSSVVRNTLALSLGLGLFRVVRSPDIPSFTTLTELVE